jgi:signal transduction histidine kinase
MRLADFIEAHAVEIADGAQAFAGTQAPAGVELDAVALRDHIPEILEAIVLDLRTSQTAAQQQAKSEGNAPCVAGPRSAAGIHGKLRAKGGFNVDQMVAEYRALRAAVLRRWMEAHPVGSLAFEDLIRFNEAIDQAVAESVADFSTEAESWRQVFLGVLGHDLRGPLGVITSTAELLSRVARDTASTELIQRISRSGKRMSRLLDDLLDYSRSMLGMGIRISRGESDLGLALQDEVDLLRASLPDARIRLETTGPTRGEFDASRLREAVGNLVNNAAKYGDAGGEIVVHLDGGPEETRLVVRNVGAPLPSESLAALFEPLQRGSRVARSGEHASLGLGLFIVREIAKAHGGEVIATAADDTTAFTIRLPTRPAGVARGRTSLRPSSASCVA